MNSLLASQSKPILLLVLVVGKHLLVPEFLEHTEGADSSISAMNSGEILV